ncbi:MAG: PQQ-binding-like beta-propeller repeat protein [Candidatus Delongbacteria bacterium]|nr:PQQ-binding-like beta-propeller repeat protein [Candidatus Delongbacteria bacterium]
MRNAAFFLLILISGLVGIGQAEPFKPFRFAWITDTHIGAERADQDLELITADINRMTDIEFVIVSGDISEMDAGTNLEKAKTILDQLNKPYHIIPGNHDLKWSQSGGCGFSSLWGSDRFDFDSHGFRWIGFHQGPYMRMADGIVSPEDLAWLDSLSSTLQPQSRGTIIVTHYPIDSSVSNYHQVIQRLSRLNPVVILHGHGHGNRVYNYNGIPGIMSRASLTDPSHPTGYSLVEFRSDSLIVAERNPVSQTDSIWHRTAWSVIPAQAIRIENPDYRAENLHSGVKELWSYQSRSTVTSSPAIADGKAVVTNRAGEVTALALKDGKVIWTFKTGGAVVSSPAIKNQVVVVTSCDSSVYGLNLIDGSLRWKLKTEGPMVGTPAIQGDTVFLGGSNRIFRAVNLDDGRVRWHFDDVKGFVETQPLVLDQDVIFGAWDGFLYCLDRPTGQLKWKWSDGRSGTLYSPAVCYPIALGKRVFIVAPDRYTTCIDRETGKTLWRSNRFKVRESIGMSQNKKHLYLHTMLDTLASISSTSDSLEVDWISHTGHGYDFAPSIPTERDGSVFFGTRRGEIFSLNAGNGKVEWKYRYGSGLIHHIIPLERHRLLVSDLNGRISCLERKP